MNYLSNTDIQSRLASAPEYQKSALTGLRVPQASEIGQTLETLVKSDGGVRRESVNTITPDTVIARNPEPIGNVDGNPQYNEWLIERSVAEKNYGQNTIAALGSEFTSHRKMNTVRMIELDQAAFDALGVEGDELAITVSWSPEPMIAKRGDYLTDAGYSVSANDMATTYALAIGDREPLVSLIEARRIKNGTTKPTNNNANKHRRPK